MRHWLPLIAAVAVACRADGPEPEIVPRVRVTTAAIVEGDMPRTVTLVGRLAPAPGNVAVMSAPADAVVRGVPVQVGQVVAAGQALIHLDVPELEAQAAAQRAVADAAERDAARQRELLREGIAAVRVVEERNAAAAGARAAAAASASLLARARVASLFAGRVQRVLAIAGERVAAGAPLVEIIRPGALDLTANVPAADMGGFRVGQPVSVTMEGDAEPVVGAVRAIAPAMDSATNARQVVIRVPAGSRLVPGAGATAVVTIGTARQVLLVSDAALVLVGDSLSVFVVGRDSTVTHAAVEVTGRAGGMVAVRGPLRVGDRVVTTGAYGLQDGMKVEPAP